MDNKTIRARITETIVWYDGPVLLHFGSTGEDGVARTFVASALPEEEGWDFVATELSPAGLADWLESRRDLRDLQQDPASAHFSARYADCEKEFFILNPVEAPLPEAWLPDEGLFRNTFDPDPETGHDASERQPQP